MKHLKVKLVVLALVVISLLVLFGASAPILAESPNPAVPTAALPTPVAKPTAGAVSPAKVPTRALVAPTTSKATSPRVAASARTSAAAFPSYTSSIALQNLSSSAASIGISYYNLSDGSSGGSYSDNILANGSKTYFPIPGAGTGFNGSAVISSNQPLGSIVNVVGGSFVALDSYVGQGSGTPSVNLPLLMKNNNGIYTWFRVQNAGSSNATVNVAYSDAKTAGPVTILPGASKEFSQALEDHGTVKIFGGTVTNSSTNQNLVVAVLTETSATMSAYTGFGTGSTAPVMPLINVQPSKHIMTGITIFNTGGSATNVTVSYTPAPPPAGAGAACTETQSVPANSNKIFALAAFASGANSTCAAGSTFVGSGRVTANSTSQTLNVLVNQAVPGSSDGAYAGSSATSATNKVVMPLIMDRNGASHNIWTGFSLMNVGSASATINCSFTSTSYTANTPRTLAAGAGFTELQKNAIMSSYVGAGTCTASNPTDKIVAIVNQIGEGAAGDQLLVYNAINQ